MYHKATNRFSKRWKIWFICLLNYNIRNISPSYRILILSRRVSCTIAIKGWKLLIVTITNIYQSIIQSNNCKTSSEEPSSEVQRLIRDR